MVARFAFGGRSKGYIKYSVKICDKKNKVLFTDSECLVLSPEFKLPDANQVLLRIPRQNNMYSFNLENIVPSGGLACLIAKATIDESNKWHRRLGHVNFKNLNKLVKGNLVRGLPSKIFQNDHTCVACQKGKQHKASCKAKSVSSISQPLQLLHMDLFGPTSVRSLNHKTYCLVITDDFSRFSWVFFLRTKDETSGILKDFIRQIKNQLNQKVKTIRCDNGTEFKNMDFIEFYGSKGIKREFSNARIPQQNRHVRSENQAYKNAGLKEANHSAVKSSEAKNEVDSNTTPDSSDLCNNEFKDDQNADDHEHECVVLANLIANLKLETNRTLGEPISTQDSCLIALQTKQKELEKYKAFNDRTIDYDKLKRTLKASEPIYSHGSSNGNILSLTSLLKWTTPTLLWRSISGLRKKARMHGMVFNLETTKYGKIWYDEDVHDLRSVETEFPAIVFNDRLTSEATLSCEPTVSSLNDNEIDFRISFDEFDDEDYTVIYDENSFSYKIISVNNLKTDFENDNDKVNMPSLPSPEPEVSYSNDLKFFKDFENEFPAIVYNDALTSKSYFLTEHFVSP
ncbi:putative ribonuclease H-like domain-containing protein [Tanacetum coccineum]